MFLFPRCKKRACKAPTAAARSHRQTSTNQLRELQEKKDCKVGHVPISLVAAFLSFTLTIKFNFKVLLRFKHFRRCYYTYNYEKVTNKARSFSQVIITHFSFLPPVA